MHKCPICGELTEGSFSEGGINFTICEKCYKEKYLQDSRERERNEIIHRQRGVDGWQELYADAPSEEDIKEEMAANNIKEESEE